MDSHVVREMVGFEIRNAREAQGLTLKQLASMAGTSYSHLWKIENAQVNVGLDLLCRIVTALDASLDIIVSPAWEKAILLEATLPPKHPKTTRTPKLLKAASKRKLLKAAAAPKPHDNPPNDRNGGIKDPVIGS